MVTCEAHMEYINYLAFILSPHMDKPPLKIAANITSLFREVRVGLKPTNRHDPKVPL